jgi:hypothetical protein
MNEEILATVQRVESDLISDRSKIDDIIVRLGDLEGRVKTLYERIPRLEDKQKDAMAEVVQPVIDSVDKLNGQLKRKKIVTRTVIVNPITEFFKRLKGGDKNG